MPQTIPFREAFRYWFRLGFINFGGPAGQIALMHRDLVEKRKWIDEDHFLQALNFCMLLPGPEAQQLAVYIGWLLHGKGGGIVAGVFFVLPSVFILWGLSWLYATMGNIPWVSSLFYGLKPAVAAIVAEAVIRIGMKTTRNGMLASLSALAFIGIYFLHIPFPLIVLAAALFGYLGGMFLPDRFSAPKREKESGPQKQSMPAEMPGPHTGIESIWPRSLKIIAVCSVLWFAPVLLLGTMRGWDDIFVDIGILFSKAAVVTFGGAYAVLSYIGQQAVDHYGWIRPEQMMDGLGLAETTPGPLIMVNQFVGYLAAYTHAKGLSPSTAGAIGGLLATWVTFVPSFMMIFLGAPFIERMRGSRTLNAALAAITASVVGVILNLAVQFTRHTLFPDTGGFDWFALAVSVTAFAGLQFFKWPMIPVIIASAFLGLAGRAMS
ncbi:MAG: chromate efflux transporter [Alphaproteobacteria bacterium]|uniref:Chromate efflux transporter n=1 Tax=Candidatus Nitrobium versatile TaxID=2884831 RepID=A0A953JBE2_9BACT|nr:chromate efflux transporter [Candidatus Nitrobium versatile]